MLVFTKERLVLLATPKTGTTALQSVLGPRAAVAIRRPPELKHTNLRRYQRFLAPYLALGTGETFETCAVMREPRDWLGSWYRYRQKDDIAPGRSTAAMSFDEFVRGYCSTPKPGYAAVGSQAQFLTGQDGQRVDHLFRYDRIDRYIAFLQERLDTVIELPRMNVSAPGDLSLEGSTERLLRQTCAADFALYDSLLKA